jgi:spore coat protein H
MPEKLNIWFPAFVSAMLVLLQGCYKEVSITENPPSEGTMKVVGFDEVYAFVDTAACFLLYTIGADTIDSFTPVVKFGDYRSVQLNDTELVNGQKNDMGRIIANQPYKLVARGDQGNDTFNLFFTTLPILQFTVEELIPDEPKIVSWMELQYSDKDQSNPSTVLFESYSGIETRGGSSAQYDKKAYGIELWDNKYGLDRSAPLLGMRYCEDWILDAMYVDDLRMRNKISFELWEKMARIPPEEGMDDVYPGIHLEYVELFINNRYMGLYGLGEKLDETLLRFSMNQAETGGVMYKSIDWANGATMFQIYDSEPTETMIWDGWEQIYPDQNHYWEPLAELRKTVVLDDDEAFERRIDSLIDLENAAEYYLFINLILAYDNAGKNIYYARYSDQSRFFMLPWDIEATWGRMWDRTNSLTVGLPGNNLFDRLIELNVCGFNDHLRMKWDAYRETIFHKDSLMHDIDRNYVMLKQSGAIDRENARWEDIQIDFDQEYVYISAWIEARLDYLDSHFQ